MNSYCTEGFWANYQALPKKVRLLADRNFRLWSDDPASPSVKFHKLRHQREPVWAASVGEHHRALCTKQGNDFVWYWIGTHEEYNGLI